MYTEKTSNGILYTEEIASIDGASFMLFPEKGHTPEMIAEATRELRSERDVVSLTVATETDRDELYRSGIFKHPAIRTLRWYEINADDLKVLRRERRKGTTIDSYVENFVPPFTAETKERNQKKYGDRIFDR